MSTTASPSDPRLAAEVARLRAFNQGAAHEMRSAIAALAHLAREAEGALDRHDALGAARHVTVMAREAGAAMSLVGALMSLTQSEPSTICPAAIALGDCAEQALQTLLLAGAARGVPPVPVAIGALPMAWADPALMTLVFVNLIGHAIQSTRGTADGRIEVYATGLEGVPAVCVQDNGIGGDAASLFEPGPDAAALDGAGLGLALVRTIVERHGGRVHAVSVPGRGTRCHLALPRLAA